MIDEVVKNSAANIEVALRNSFMNVQPMNSFIEEGQQLAEPKELIQNVVVEGETTILFGDTGLGKSTFAIQMGIEMAEQDKRVLYVNFELSKRQLSRRFHGKEISDNLFCVTVDYSKMLDVTDQERVLSEIESHALEHHADVIIIDNLTNLCINSKEGSEAGRVMLRLISLRMVHNWTMVVLAHVPKRNASDPITLNDLAGSKIISNMVDNVVAINRSKKDKDMRYLIQLKSRSSSIVLDSNHVQELTLSESDGYLHFEYGGFSEEFYHLPRSRDEKAELEREIVKELKELNGLSYRDIAEKLGTSLGNVQRVAKGHGLCRNKNKDK